MDKQQSCKFIGPLLFYTYVADVSLTVLRYKNLHVYFSRLHKKNKFKGFASDSLYPLLIDYLLKVLRFACHR